MKKVLILLALFGAMLAVWGQSVTHKSDHENNVMPNVRQIKATLGADLEIKSGGNFIELDSKVSNEEALIPKCGFTEGEGAVNCINPMASQLIPQYLVNSDESGEYVGTGKPFYFPPSLGTILKKYYVKAGATIATDTVFFSFYRGTSAGDINDSNLFYTGAVPPDKWTSPGAEVSFTILEAGYGNYEGVDRLSFAKGEGTVLVLSSVSNFALKTNAGQDELWYKADLHFVNERIILDQYSTRTPFLLLEGDNPPYTVPLTQNVVRAIGNLKIDSSDGVAGKSEFELIGDSMYVYNGLEQAWYRGITAVSAIGNTNNCETQWGITIIDSSGVADTSLSAEREFDGNNEGSLPILTNGRLTMGDTIKPVINAPNKNCPNFEITNFKKHIVKIN